MKNFLKTRFDKILFTVSCFITVFVFGQPVASFKLDREGKATIELDRFPAGLYLAQILDQNQVLYSQKLPIQQ